MFSFTDIDECSSKPGPCTLEHQECVNNPDSYTCECVEGYEKLETGLCSGL